MFISVEAYLKRLTMSLENTIAPEIESNRVRGQVFAVINLLDQLATRIEYKPALIREEIDLALKTARDIAGDSASAELAERLKEGPAADLSGLVRADETFSMAIEHFFAVKGNLPEDARARADKQIREAITKISTRDIGLTKPPNFEKISRSRREAK